MTNFIYNFVKDGDGNCCTGVSCSSVIVSGEHCYTCGSGECTYHKCVCASGTAPQKIPCSVLLDQDGCVNKYTYEGDTGNCYYHACDDQEWDLDSTQIVYNRASGHWETLGYPPQVDFYTWTGCSPLGEYSHPSGYHLDVTICTWCSGCDCGPEGPIGSCGGVGWHSSSGCLDA